MAVSLISIASPGKIRQFNVGICYWRCKSTVINLQWTITLSGSSLTNWSAANFQSVVLHNNQNHIKNHNKTLHVKHAALTKKKYQQRYQILFIAAAKKEKEVCRKFATSSNKLWNLKTKNKLWSIVLMWAEAIIVMENTIANTSTVPHEYPSLLI